MKFLSRNVKAIVFTTTVVLMLAGCSTTHTDETVEASSIEKETMTSVASVSEDMGTMAPTDTTEVETPEMVIEEPQVVYPYGVQGVVKTDADTKDFDLYIVHTNDVHGHLDSNGTTEIGYPKFATLLKVGKELAHNNVLVLDAGDFSSGTNLVNSFNGEPAYTCLEMAGYDALTPGNHEFDYDQSVVENEAQKTDSTKIISANILDDKGNLVFQPYEIYQYNGFKVAVIGLITPDTKTAAKFVKGLTFVNPLDYQEEAQRAIDSAHEIADYVVVLGHFGNDTTASVTSEEICQNIDGIDLFIDGHSHQINNEVVNGTLIVQTGSHFENIGVVDVSVRDGKAVQSNETLIKASDVLDCENSPLAQSVGIAAIPDDADLAMYIDHVAQTVESLLGKVIANIPATLAGDRASVRTKSMPLGTLVAKAMTAETGADVSFINGGNLRSDLTKGDVTIGDVQNVLPYGNTLVTVQMTGAALKQAFEDGYASIPEPQGKFTQTDAKVIYNKFAPSGSRIQLILINNTMLDENALYTVCTSDYIANGGDGYTEFSGEQTLTAVTTKQAVINYLSSK